MGVVMSGEATPAQIGGLLVGLRAKGETVDEITGFAEAMAEHVVPVTPTRAPLVDVVGTGGDGAGTFNISTTAALVAAARGSGRREARKPRRELGVWLGGRARGSSASRSSSRPSGSPRSIDEHGFGFMFARAHHPAMRHAAPVRQELGTRTVFNVLGPLANPAGARDGVFGVYSPSLARTYAETLAGLGARRAFVVHGDGGLDELSPSGPNLVVEVVDGEIHEWELDPRVARDLPLSPGELHGGEPGGQRRGRPARAGGRARRAAGRRRAERRRRARRRGARRRPRRGRRGRRRRAIDSGAAARHARAARGVLERGADLMGRFADALRAPGLGAIAEIKRRSPSAGDLRPDADPARIAPAYAGAGAAAISVLVDERFAGSWDDLRAARAATDAPLLAKGFFSTPDDLRTAKEAGADAALLLLRDLDDAHDGAHG